MLSEPVIYLLTGLAIANAFLIGWVLRVVKSHAGSKFEPGASSGDPIPPFVKIVEWNPRNLGFRV